MSDIMTITEVENEFGFSISTLAKWRMQKINLPFSKMGNFIFYKRSDILKMIDENIVTVKKYYFTNNEKHRLEILAKEKDK